MKKLLKSNRGITMLEIMVGVVIIGITASMAVPRFMTAIQRMNFRSANREMMSTIREARSLAISTRIPHGIYIDAGAREMVLFQKLGMIDSTYQSGVDSIITVEDFAGEDGVSADQVEYIGSTFLNNVALFYSNGSASSGGYAWTCLYTEDISGVALFHILQSTGKVETIWEVF